MNARWWFLWRKSKNIVMVVLTVLCVVIAVLPLFMIFSYTVVQGIGAINFDFFIHMPKPVGEPGGGMANALVGTLILIGLGSVVGLPIGILAGIYLAEYGNNPFATSIRFLADVLSGIPSIVIGVVAYGLVVVPMKSFSALAFCLSSILRWISGSTSLEMSTLTNSSATEIFSSTTLIIR